MTIPGNNSWGILGTLGGNVTGYPGQMSRRILEAIQLKLLAESKIEIPERKCCCNIKKSACNCGFWGSNWSPGGFRGVPRALKKLLKRDFIIKAFQGGSRDFREVLGDKIETPRDLMTGLERLQTVSRGFTKYQVISVRGFSWVSRYFRGFQKSLWAHEFQGV